MRSIENGRVLFFRNLGGINARTQRCKGAMRVSQNWYFLRSLVCFGVFYCLLVFAQRVSELLSPIQNRRF
jgi:hypothetical protein